MRHLLRHYEKNEFHVIRLAVRDCMLGTVGRFFAGRRSANVDMGPERWSDWNWRLGHLEHERTQLGKRDSVPGLE